MPGPKPKNPANSIRTTIVMPRVLNERIAVIAIKENRSLSAQALYLLRLGVIDYEMSETDDHQK